MEDEKGSSAVDEGPDVWHLCLEVRGEGAGCANCPVNKAGLCNELIKAIKKVINSLNNFPSIPIESRRDIIAITVAAAITGFDNFRGQLGNAFPAWVKRIYENKRNDYFRQAYRDQRLVFTDRSLARLREEIDNPYLIKTLQGLVSREFNHKDQLRKALGESLKISSVPDELVERVFEKLEMVDLVPWGQNSEKEGDDLEEKFRCLEELVPRDHTGHLGRWLQVFLIRQAGFTLKEIAREMGLNYDILRQNFNRDWPKTIQRLLKQEGCL